jgi:hypothetical protein
MYARAAGALRNSFGFPAIYLTVPNLPVFFFERKMWLSPHGYINVECLFVGALALFLPRSATFLLLVLEMVASFVYLVCYTYQFSLVSLWLSFHYLSLLPAGRGSTALGALVTILVLSVVLAYGIPLPAAGSRISVVAVLMALGFLLISLDTFDGRNPVLPRDVARASPRLTITPLAALGNRGILFRSIEASSQNSSSAHMDSASAKGIGFLGHTPAAQRPNMVLILVESWGLLRDANSGDALEAGYRLDSITSKFRVSAGAVPFDGLTVPGEGRELCHSHIGFGLLNLSNAEKGGCLPARFHLDGYQNIAVHGYVGGMFRRAEWYKSIGFDQRLFSPDLEQAGLRHCDGAFPGICDGAIADWIGRVLLSDNSARPKFIYWVTLNSHLPVPADPNLPRDQACTLFHELANSESLCSWFRLVATLQQSVLDLALESQTRPTVFVIVGDHAPPFADPHLSQLFSNTDVPYVVLTPRTIAQ